MNVASIASNVNANHMDQVVHFLLSKSERGEIPPETARQRCTAIKLVLAHVDVADEVAFLAADLRGYAEFDVQNRTEGGSVFLTIDLPLSALAHRGT
mgnify:CR=1 FL=1